MKKVFITSLLLICINLSAQEYYWTSYSFNVEPEDEEIVAKLTNDYFSAKNSKADGISVYLFENHFHDSSLSSSHEIVFAGTYEAMGDQYSQGENPSWDLYLAKLGQYTKRYSAAAGNSIYSFGVPGSHPVQNLLWLNVSDASKFAAGFKNYHSKNNPEDRRVTLGKFRLGRSPLGESHYVLIGVNDFKTAMNAGLYRESNPAAKQAWAKYMKEIDGAVDLVRTSTRVMVGKW
tara:strand:+ start:63 stop:761 length:699 start_codon:yes stop_codon:yes gene_type:complete